MDRRRVIKNVAASVDQRLRNLSAQDQLVLDDVRIRYVTERFLYRLSLSPYKNDYVLKGAFMLQTMAESLYRPTRDVDLQGYVHVEPQAAAGHFRDVLEQDTSAPSDGPRFVQESIRVESLHGVVGYRLKVEARLGPSRYTMQADIAYGDRPTPAPVERTIPSLLNLPAPVLLCYRVETSLAEKFHAVVSHGDQNTRMKDYFDFWYVANQLPVSGPDLAAALRAVFDNRNKPLPAATPVGLTDGFAQNKQPDWTKFRAKLRGVERGPEDLSDLVKEIRAFFMPVVRVAETDPEFRGRWDADRGRWTDPRRGQGDAIPAPREGKRTGKIAW